MWRDILVANREELLAQSKLFQQNLHALEKLIASSDGDALERLIEQASDTRANWRISSQKPPK
jgi:prephenate dehydrogenase